MIAVAVLSALLSSANPTPIGRVLLVNYQAVGVERADIDLAFAAWRDALEQNGAQVLIDEKLNRVSAQCGEEPSCLATLASRGPAPWVLAFGLAQVGGQCVSSAVLVESRSATLVGHQTTGLPQGPTGRPPDWRAHTKETVAKFLAAIVVTPDPPAGLVSTPPKPPPNPLHPYAWAAGATSAAALLSSLIVGSVAWSNYDQLKQLPMEERGPLTSRQLTLNHTADGLLIAGAVMGAVSATLFLWPQPKIPVSVSVTGPGVAVQGKW